MSIPPLPIETERLSLRPFHDQDFDAYRSYHALPEVYRYLYAAPPTVEDARATFKTITHPALLRDGDEIRLAVTRRTDGALLGEVLLKLANQTALQAEVGYIFNPAFGRKGYASEAVRALIDAGFALGLHRIFARLDTANRGSIGVVERLGLRREAHLVQNDRFNGVWGDEFIYAMLADEWRKLAD